MFSCRQVDELEVGDPMDCGSLVCEDGRCDNDAGCGQICTEQDRGVPGIAAAAGRGNSWISDHDRHDETMAFTASQCFQYLAEWR